MISRAEIEAIATAAARRAVATSPTPRLRPGTMSTYDAATRAGTVVVDGDADPVPCQVIVPAAAPPGSRVMAMFVPPHGCFVVGFAAPFTAQAWTSFTPVFTGPASTPAQRYGRYRILGPVDGGSPQVGGRVLEFEAGAKLAGAVNTTIAMAGPAGLLASSHPAGSGWVFGPGVGVAYASDESATRRWPGTFTPLDGTNTWAFRPTSGTAAIGWGATAPFTWAVDDEIHLAGRFVLAD